MMELNPNHPMTAGVHDHWYKLAAMLVNRIPGQRTVITEDEIRRMDGKAITMKETAAGIELRIVTMEEGERLANEEGQ
jgi:hypothetical protein